MLVRRGRPRSPNFDSDRVSCTVTSFGCLGSAIPSDQTVTVVYNVFGFQLHVALLQHAVLSYFLDEGNAACNVWVVTAAKILSLVTSNFPQLIYSFIPGQERTVLARKQPQLKFIPSYSSRTLVVCQYE